MTISRATPNMKIINVVCTLLCEQRNGEVVAQTREFSTFCSTNQLKYFVH
jgi:hypothetical protein